MSVALVSPAHTQLFLHDQNEQKTDFICSTAVRSSKLQKDLAVLGKFKKSIAFLVTAKHTFFNSLEGLKDSTPSDAAVVALVPIACSKNDTAEQVFDLVVRYETSSCSVYGLKTLNDSYYPDLRRIVDEIVKIVPKEKIQLIHTDEWTSSELSRLREKHELTGAYPKDIERLCCKNLVAQIAEDAKIPHAKTVFLDFRQPINRKEFLNRIILKITKFPMFVKPNRMCGSAGIAKIANMEVLEKWLTERFQEEIPGEYVIQEFIEGEEFGVTVVLLPDGTWKPLIVDFLAGTTYQEAILKGEPLFMAALEFGKAVNGSFPNLREFTQKVIDAFRPQHPQIFCIQAFQLFPGTDQYVLNELAYRVNGDRTNAVLYPTCGISQFTAVTLAHINPNYYPTENPAWKPQIQTLVSFMQQEGTLQSQNDCVLRTNLKSKIELKWFTNAGDSMPVPFRISDTLVKFMLYSTTEDERDADLEWIRKNWRPDVG